MEKTSEVVGKALFEKNLKRNRKQMEPNSRPLDNAPSDLPDNDMAPPTRKRAKVVIFLDISDIFLKFPFFLGYQTRTCSTTSSTSTRSTIVPSSASKPTSSNSASDCSSAGTWSTDNSNFTISAYSTYRPSLQTIYAFRPCSKFHQYSKFIPGLKLGWAVSSKRYGGCP